jgi:hypothetical protein
MSIEDSLSRIAIALEKMAGIETEKRGPGRPPKATRTLVAPAEPEPEAPAPVEAPVAEAKPVEAAPAPTPAPAPAKAVKATPVEAYEFTADDVRSALVSLQKRTTPETARSLLKTVGGADTLRALKPEKYSAVIDAANKA